MSAVKRAFRNPFEERQNECPEVWGSIAEELKWRFLANGECTDAARAAIRAAFHDCFPGQGCDGSLFLAQEFTRERENGGLAPISENLGKLAQAKGVSVADMFQFASAYAIATCPMGPRIPAYVGRTDSSAPAPEGELPNPFMTGDAVLASFRAKGFSARDLAALIGAHTAAKQFRVDPSQQGAALDSTPGVWDVSYYQQLLDNTAPFRIPADLGVAHQPETGEHFNSFIGNQFGWNAAFSSAMEKMSLLGVPGGAASLVDCSRFLPSGSGQRDKRAAPINGRIL
ncbi:fungal class II heme-containing peroxidase [Coniosporium apollinis]|uniref:Peroxidase n=1 Tax=Coniosporium apollinis TaxID=61459 RepID=A0ABQ9P0L3_9PEZI|nr:fungal class II heme-containing peroxidase [Coniosporium apollinis]